MNVNQQYQLKDRRDQKTYYVAKLEDGNIWMTQNLDHDIVTGSSVTYDSTTTDLPEGVTWNPENATITTLSSWERGDKTHPQSYDPGNRCWNEIIHTEASPNNYNYWTIGGNTVTCTQKGNHYHIGNYYNWKAATVQNSDSSQFYNFSDIDVDQSICPAGWTLPKSAPPTSRKDPIII